MNSIIQIAAVTLSILFVCVFCQASDGATIRAQIAALQSSGKVVELVPIVRELEELYVSNLPSYVSNRAEFDSALEFLANTNIEARAVLKAQIHLVLGRQIQTTNSESATLLFRLKETSVSRLVRISSSRIERESCQFLAAFLGEIRLAITPNFQPLQVFDNVAPPLSSGGPMSAGMNPDAIPDPKAKSAYLAAIETNINNYCQNRLQIDVLPHLNKFVTGVVLDAFRAKAGQREFSSEELARLAHIAHLSQSEKLSIGIEENR